MRKLYDTTCGLYHPAFFRIDLKEEFNFTDWNKNTNHQKSVFLHEYIHYLQDITTTYGYLNFVSISKELQAYLYKAGTQKETIIRIPIIISDIKNEEFDNALRDIYHGDEEYKSCTLIERITVEKNQIFMELIGEEIGSQPEVILHFKNEKYRFGGGCVTESMAYLIESELYQEEKMSRTMPYNACELVCQFMYPQLLKNRNCLIALCDVALMSFHPGLTFYDALVKMKVVNFEPTCVNDVYDFVYKLKKEWKYVEAYTDALEAIDFLYTTRVANTEQLNLWLKEKFKLGYNSRRELNNRDFIIKIANKRTVKEAEEYFLSLMSKFGMPVITDKDNNIYDSNMQQEDMGLLLVFGPLALRKIFSSLTDCQCEMYEFCQQYDQAESVCKTAPWEMVKKEKLCPLAQFWYQFGLENKSVLK